MPDRLYIIGNGFDLHHGIASSYAAFGTYLRAIDRETFDIVTRYIAESELWSDLESALAYLDVETLIGDAGSQLMGYGDDDWRDSANHDFQWEIDRVVSAASQSLREHFATWVRQLQIPAWSALKVAPLRIDTDARFLNFNYTPSLERLYGVPGENILYLHGAAERPHDDIVLGHGWRRTELDSLNRHIDPEAADVRVMEGHRIVDQYFTSTFKPAYEIIAQNEDFWASCSQIAEIFVLGHSLAPVDHEYFREIVRAAPESGVRWTVSYYGEIGDKPDQLAALDVPHAAIRYVQLPDLA